MLGIDGEEAELGEVAHGRLEFDLAPAVADVEYGTPHRATSFRKSTAPGIASERASLIVARHQREL